MNRPALSIRLLHMLWSLIPWLVVAALAIFVIDTAGRISTEKQVQEDERRRAVGVDTPPANVIILIVSPRPLADAITLPAEIKADQELWVKAEVSGVITETHVREGLKLESGQALVSLDDRDYRIRLARIDANHALAQTEYNRNLVLAKTNATAQANLDSIEARLKDLEAQKMEASLALERTVIRAPISCVLNQLEARKGDFLGVGDPVAQILKMDPVKVTVGVPERDVAAVFDLKEAEVTIPALENKVVRAKKTFLARQPRTLARLYDLELEIPNPEGRILPGMFARVRLVKETFDQAVTVPVYAVLTRGNEQYVFVESNGKAEKRPVETGLISGWEIHVTAGLYPGDKVVVVGHRAIEDGRPLEVIQSVTDQAEILGR